MKPKTKPKNPPKKKPAPAAAPTPARAAPTSAPVDDVRTEGQRRLTAVDASHGAVAMKVGVSKQVVSMWRKGAKLPAAAARAKLASAYEIPIESWERAPVIADELVTAARVVTNAPLAPTSATPGRSTLHHVLDLIRRLEGELETKALSATVRRGINADLTRALSLRARLEKEEELAEERIVLEHPFWHRITVTLLRVLKPHPEVAREVAIALKGIGA